MKKLTLRLSGMAVLFFFIFTLSVSGQTRLEKELQQLAKTYPITFKKMPVDSFFTEKYLIEFKEPLDHNHPNGKTFTQRIFLSNKGLDKPVVFVTEGYWANYAANPKYVNELCPILNANQIVLEHRFFPPSAPDSLDWRYLTVQQAAADDHAVVEMLKHIYHGKWLSTGISKGGQTCMIYRYFYPDDVTASVPYVAPLNFSITDRRINMFLDSVGTPACRKAVFNFQKELISHRNKYLPYFKQEAKAKGYTYSRIGWEKAFDLMVFEFRFAFWQWGKARCDAIPMTPDNPMKMVKYWDKVADFSWVSDQGIKRFEPFFYEAMKQMGMYGYNIAPFKQWTVFKHNPNFNFTLPKGTKPGFDPSVMDSVDCFIRHKAHNMMFLVGGDDPWGSTSVNLTYQNNLVKFVKPGGSHLTRINNLPPAMKKRAISILKKWMGEMPDSAQ
ncbi:peptidase [Candidatus Sulfidibacterium hydrothermale]|uniref:S28 family serine protease n=1 Tax=Candidatus Sulfidibacterium hydrothermale TaxID=2875962 RepID=UPI001F0A629A|nr:S28 family serine protease [Candidatus Sulfidibacterium hydrothermale]UBM62190.1 peptidase [Candidatus Sulfidibacterium hydrothermale]